MSQIHKELAYLKELMIEMLELVKGQMQHSKTAIYDFDLGLAESILRTETRINALEINIEKECENLIALFQPVATDLRFILSIFKSVSELERIGDHARFFAKALLNKQEPINPQLLNELNISQMIDTICVMFDEVIYALNNQDTSIARSVFKKDKEINMMFKKSIILLNTEIVKCSSENNDILTGYAIMARLERTANLLTNVAEEIIFYVEAKVLKHDKQAKKEFQSKTD